jgi:hypothetical protein
VIAYKGENEFSYEEYYSIVRSLLQMSTVRTVRVFLKNDKAPVGSELQLLDVWMALWKAAYEVK